MSATKLAKARTDLEGSTGASGPFIDLIMQLLPVIMQLCGLTPKQAHEMATNNPRLTEMMLAGAYVRQGLTLRQARQASKGVVALAATTPVDDVDDVVTALEA